MSKDTICGFEPCVARINSLETKREMAEFTETTSAKLGVMAWRMDEMTKDLVNFTQNLTRELQTVRNELLALLEIVTNGKDT